MDDIEGLNDFLNYLNRVANNVDNIINDSLEETATMIIADTKLSTPVKTGALRRSWTHSEVKSNSNGKNIEVGSSLEYAKSIEEGHRTRGSGYVQGKFMLKDSITKNKDKLQNKVTEKLNNIR